MHSVFSVNIDGSSTNQKRSPRAASHSGGYACTHCGKRFNRSEHVKRHERLHTKERPFSCPVCNRVFVRQDVLSRHIKFLHPERKTVSQTEDRFKMYGVKTKNSQKASNMRETASSDTSETFVLDTSSTNTNIELGPTAVETQNQNEPDLEQEDLFQNEHQFIEQMPSFLATDLVSSGSDEAILSGPFDTRELENLDIFGSYGLNYFESQEAEQPKAISLPSPGFSSTQSPLSRLWFSQTGEMIQATEDTLNLETYSRTDPPAVVLELSAFNQEARGVVVSDFKERLKSLYPSFCSDTEEFASTSTIIRFTESYFTFFHPHLPFINRESFDLWTSSPELVLAVAAVGALYAFESDPAFELHCYAKDLVSHFEKTTCFSKEQTPLQILQATFLNMIVACWSGDSRGLRVACSIKSDLASRIIGLAKQSYGIYNDTIPGTPEAIDKRRDYDEVLRTFYAVFIFSGSMTAAFGEVPAILNHDCKGLYLPSEVPERFDEALQRFSRGETIKCDSFTARILITAIFGEVWLTTHLSCSANTADDGWRSRMRTMLRAWKQSIPSLTSHSNAALPTPFQALDPLMADSMDLYRVTQVQLVFNLDPLIEEFQDYDKSYDKRARSLLGIRDSISRQWLEDPETIASCYEAMNEIIGPGIAFMSQTLAFSSSPDRLALTSVLCALLCLLVDSEANSLSKTDTKAQLYNLLQNAGWRQMGDSVGKSLARTWASILNNVWIWRISPEHAKLFTSFADSLSPTSTSMY